MYFETKLNPVPVHVGTKEDVINVEEQFLDGIYNPDFIEEPSSDDDTDGVSLDEKNINSNERDGVNGDSKSDKLAKRKRNDSGKAVAIVLISLSQYLLTLISR